ncbi:MAG: multidrug effflux MFS transporter [SAR324 cluster bacterium]|nr:multidrug effflux MFS transporter [SAR324 cluster bacterium]
MPDRRPSLLVLIAITMIGQLAMNITLPSLTGIIEEFATTKAIAQLNLSLYMAGTATALLIYGPLSERHGRRPMVLIGMLLFILGSIVCLISASIEVMIASRVIQAVGACAGIVMGRAMVRDMFSMDKAAAMIANLTSAVVIVPGLAPLIGGILDDWYGWRLSIAFVLFLGILITIYAFYSAHETLPKEKRHEAKFGELFKAFGILLKNRIFNAYALQVSFNTAAYFSFLGGSSIIFKLMNWGNSTELGFYFFSVTCFYIVGNFGTAKFAHIFGARKVNIAGTIIALAATTLLIVLENFSGLTALSFFGTTCFLGLGNGLSISSGIAIALSADSQRVGAAAGMSGSLQLGLGGIAAWLVSWLLVDTPTPLVLTMFAGSLIGFIASVIGIFLLQKPMNPTIEGQA